MTHTSRLRHTAVRLWAGVCLVALCTALSAQAQQPPRHKVDPDWPKPLPNTWKMQGVTGLAVDKNDNIWVLTRPSDATDLEVHAALNPPIAECCVKPAEMIHFDQSGNVIGWFEAKEGHGMDVDSQGFVYIGSDTVRKYDPKDGKVIKEVARVPEPTPDAAALANLTPAAREATITAFRAKYPPSTPMIASNLEEIRIDEPAREMYVADSYLGGRVLVFDLDTFAFKRGWGAYGKPLSQISTNDADREYTPGGPMPKEFRGHLTLNFSNDGLVYAADRNANRIHVTTKEGKFLKEFVLAPLTGDRGSTGGVAFSPDAKQQYLFISDIVNNTIWFLNREDGKVVGRLGSMGDNGGLFFGLHMIATDSKGNIYTGEVRQKRVQRFLQVE